MSAILLRRVGDSLITFSELVVGCDSICGHFRWQGHPDCPPVLAQAIVGTQF
jgi:hypothetical protein